MRRLSRDVTETPKRPRAPVWRGSCRSSPPIQTLNSEKTCISSTRFSSKSCTRDTRNSIMAFPVGETRRAARNAALTESWRGRTAWSSVARWCCRQKQIDAIMIRIVLDWLEYDRIVLDTVKLAVFQGRKKSVFRDRCELSGSVLKQLDGA